MSTIEGAFVDVTEEGVIRLLSDGPSREDLVTISIDEITDARVLTWAPQAVFRGSDARFDYGVLVSVNMDGHHCYGEVVAAWQGILMVRRSNGNYIKAPANVVYLA